MPATVDAKRVLIGTPDQLTTGAILSAPLGTAVPGADALTKDGATLDPAFEASGYVSSDGLTLTQDISTTNIQEWSGATVRKILESFDGTLAWKMIETNAESFAVAFGEDYVTSTAATTGHGNRLSAAIGARLPKARTWAFKMKDGDARMLIVVPNGQVTSRDEVTFSATDAVGWGVTLSCYPDATGTSIYIYLDDGQVVKSSTAAAQAAAKAAKAAA